MCIMDSGVARLEFLESQRKGKQAICGHEAKTPVAMHECSTGSSLPASERAAVCDRS